MLLSTYVDVPRNRCHMNAGYTEKIVIYGMTNADLFPKIHLHLRYVLYTQECCFHLLNDVFIHSQLLSDAA